MDHHAKHIREEKVKKTRYFLHLLLIVEQYIQFQKRQFVFFVRLSWLFVSPFVYLHTRLIFEEEKNYREFIFMNIRLYHGT